LGAIIFVIVSNAFSDKNKQNHSSEKNESDINTLINWNANSNSKENNYLEPESSDSEEANFSKKSKKEQSPKKQTRRGKWPDNEEKLVLNYFKKHVQQKIALKKHECEEYVKQNREKITITDWVKIKTLVYNSL